MNETGKVIRFNKENLPVIKANTPELLHEMFESVAEAESRLGYGFYLALDYIKTSAGPAEQCWFITAESLYEEFQYNGESPMTQWVELRRKNKPLV